MNLGGLALSEVEELALSEVEGYYDGPFHEVNMYPIDRKYTKDHEWVTIAGTRGRIGITDYAQKQLGDVVYLELPEVGAELRQGEVFGTVESVKAVSELFAPLSGRVVEINTALRDRPEGINADAHVAWMIDLELTSPAEAKSLLDAAAYEGLTK